MADLSFNNNNNNNSNAVPNYLNDLFGDCFFTPEGEAVFLSEEADRNNIVSSSEATPATVASRIMEDGSAVPAIAAGGIAATNLDKPGLHATVMGPSTVATTTTTAAVATQQPASDANKVLDDPDFNFIKPLQTAQQNFVVTDPSLPDNPIVYATQGFLNLTGYTLDQVLGRNCRFLQGPETDPKAVDKIRKAIEAGIDMSVCLLNYRADGTTFWNQFFIAALRDAAGNVTNYVGVQCKVSDQYAATVCKRQSEIDDDENDADQDVDDDL